MRPDGTRVKDLPPLVAAIPYIMPKRYDAWNSVTENIDEEVIKDFIRTHRRAGVRLNHMSVIISAYYKAVLRNPKLNYFVMTGRIYRRNHFCVSFVILKKQADGVVNETTLKVYLDENDTVFTVNQKIKDAIDANKAEHQSNSTDKFAKFMFSVPGLPNLWCGWPITWISTVCCPGRSSICPPSTPACSSPTWPPSRPAISTTTAMNSAPPACSCAWASLCPTTYPAT